MNRRILLVDIGASLRIVGEVSSGQKDEPWSATFFAEGGLGQYAWAISSGALPSGATALSYPDSSRADTVAEPLTAAGFFTFTVRLTDTLLRRSVTRAFTVLVVEAFVPITYLTTEDDERLTTEAGDPLIRDF